MSLKDKYNKTNAATPRKTTAEQLLEGNTEIQKEGNTELKKATFVLDAELHTKLKVQAAKEGRKMAEIVTESLKKYFADL